MENSVRPGQVNDINAHRFTENHQVYEPVMLEVGVNGLLIYLNKR